MRYWYLLLVLLTGCSSQQGIEAFIAPGVPSHCQRLSAPNHLTASSC